MTTPEETPRRPGARDVAVLIGLLAVLEGEVRVSALDGAEVPEWISHLSGRLTRDGLLPVDAGTEDLARALYDLNMRLRYVLGELDELPRGSRP